MELLDASAGRMVSGGEAFFDTYESDWSGGGGGGGGGGGSYEPWEAGWGSWDQPSPPSEGHLAFDNAVTAATGARTAIATTAFVEAFLEGAGATAWAGPAAGLVGIVAGGFAYYGTKKLLEH